MCDLRVVHLYRRADARSRHRLLAVSECLHRVRRGHRHGHCLHLCRHGRDEGHHLHTGRAVLRADFRLYGSGDLHLDHAHRECDSAAWLWRRAGRRARRFAAGAAGRLAAGVWIQCLHFGPARHNRPGVHHRRPHVRHGGPAACNRKVFHRAQSERCAEIRWLRASLHRDPLHHSAGGRRLCARESAADHSRHAVRGSSRMVQELGKDQARCV